MTQPSTPFTRAVVDGAARPRTLDATKAATATARAATGVVAAAAACVFLLALVMAGPGWMTPLLPVVGTLRGIPVPGMVPTIGVWMSPVQNPEEYLVRYASGSDLDHLLFRVFDYNDDDSRAVNQTISRSDRRDPNDPWPWLHDWPAVPDAALSPRATHPLTKIDLAGGTAVASNDAEWNGAGTSILSLENTGTFRGRTDPRPGEMKFTQQWGRDPGVGTYTLDGVVVRGTANRGSHRRESPCFRYDAQLWWDSLGFMSTRTQMSLVIIDRVTRRPIAPGVLIDKSSRGGTWTGPHWTPDSRYVLIYSGEEAKVWIYPNTAWTPDNGPRPASVGPLPPNLKAPPPSPNIFPL
jgi:hypothetical protein